MDLRNMRDKINYLSIANSPYRISYSVFNGKKLEHIGFRNIDNRLLNNNIISSIETHIKDLIKSYDIDIIIMSEIDINNYSKKDLMKLVEYKTIISLVAIQNGCLFSEFKTSGWEQRLTHTKNLSNVRKVKIVNYGYDLLLNKQESDIADSIILGEAVAHNKLHIGS